MPTYRYICHTCQTEMEFWRSIHDTSPSPSHCDAPLTKIFTVPYTSKVGVHGREAIRVDTTERHWDKDMAAYKRLRNDGHQPRTIDGCDRLEATAVSNWQVKTGQPHPDNRVNEAQEMAKSIMRS